MNRASIRVLMIFLVAFFCSTSVWAQPEAKVEDPKQVEVGDPQQVIGEGPMQVEDGKPKDVEVTNPNQVKVEKPQDVKVKNQRVPLAGRLGVGIETGLMAPFDSTSAMLALATHMGAIAVGYDVGSFRIDGLFSLSYLEDGWTAFSLGGRFYYVLHQGRSADFSVGASLSLGLIDPELGNDRFRAALEAGAQIRAFVTPSVALLATLSLGGSFGDGQSAVKIAGQLNGALGIMYYF